MGMLNKLFGKRNKSKNPSKTVEPKIFTQTCWHADNSDNRPCKVWVSPNGKQLLAVGFEYARIWDLLSRECLCTLIAREVVSSTFDLESGINLACFHPDGKRIFIVSHGNMISWDLDNGKATCMITENNDVGMSGLVITPDGRWIFTVGNTTIGRERELNQWDSTSGEHINCIPAVHKKDIKVMAVNRDATRLLTAGYDTKMCLFDLKKGQHLRTLEGHEDMVTGVCILPSENRAASIGRDGVLRLWNIATGACEQEASTAVRYPVTIDMDRKGVLLAVSGAAGERSMQIEVFDASSGKIIQRFEHKNTHVVESVAFALDARSIFSSDDKGMICQWPLADAVHQKIKTGNTDITKEPPTTPQIKANNTAPDPVPTKRWWEFREFGKDANTLGVVIVGGDNTVKIQIPSFVQDIENNERVRMDIDSGDYWYLFRTDETDDRYNDQGGIDIGLVHDNMSATEWYDIRRRYGQVISGHPPGSFHCPLGKAHLTVRGGTHDFLVPEWLQFDIYIPNAIGSFSAKISYTGSRKLFKQGRGAAIVQMVKSIKL